MINSVKSLLEVYEDHRCILTLIHVNVPVIRTVKQTGVNRVQRSKPRLFGKKKPVFVKVVVKLVVNQLFENRGQKPQEAHITDY